MRDIYTKGASSAIPSRRLTLAVARAMLRLAIARSAHTTSTEGATDATSVLRHRRRHAGRGLPGRGGLRAATGAAAVRDYESPGHRQRLHLPLREPPVDVRGHLGGRDRDRPDRLRPAAGGGDLHRRDQEGLAPAEQR